MSAGLLAAALLMITSAVRWAAFAVIYTGQTLIRTAYSWLEWSERAGRP